ncbi:MAG: Cof-type HAD-IIB family hydrolase [Clostridiales bacterium]|nr:Cof-type HAD-IIB family hydrolase [Clostridiales bacterium]
MIKLIVSDLDGTLIPEGTGYLPTEVKALLDEVQRSGLHLAVSSGRQAPSIRRALSTLEREPLIISQNGSCIFRGDRLLYTDPMPRQAALAAAEEASRWPRCDVVLETAEQCWVYHGFNGVVEEQLLSRRYQYAVIHDLADVEGAVVKVACYIKQDIDGFASWAKGAWSDRLLVARSGVSWVDFNVTDKGKGLLAACRLLGVSPEETLAFGDNLNDEPMLAAAGRGYSVAGGNPELTSRYPTCIHPSEVIKKILPEREENACISKMTVL